MQSTAAEWRKQTAVQLISSELWRGARKLPLFAFIGMVMSKQHEKENLFAQIRKLHETKAASRPAMVDEHFYSLDSMELGHLIATGCNAAVYEARFIRGKVESATKETFIKKYDMAVKMMFNYDIESNAEAVSTAMAKEAVPVSLPAVCYQQDYRWHNGNHVRKKAFPPHPNIVWMYGAFVDSVPDLPSNTVHYPAALPSRIHADGLGRNTTMFLVMKRYSCTLTEYLSIEKPSMVTRCLLLCQLLEGIIYLQQQGLAHRDLKSDNLLLDLSTVSDCPVLVISDFGCCLYNEESLKVPYLTSEISKGGNSALMAPEIACAKPGAQSVLDYRKSDLWTAGVLTYEIFGMTNPFYRSSSRPSRLNSQTYEERELPKLPGDSPGVIQKLTRNVLCRDPCKRLSTAAAGTVVQLYLWGPTEWWQSGVAPPQINTVQECIVSLAAQHACQAHYSKHTIVGNTLKETFLLRISLEDFESAVTFLQTKQENW